jgi:hypothetical protein
MSEKVTNGGVKVNSSITNTELPDRRPKLDLPFDLTVPEAIDTTRSLYLTCHDSANYRLTGATRTP